MAGLPLRLGPGGFRLVLALVVVGSHLTAFGLGRPAVMLFFMLSGYWVPRMYEQKYRPAVPVWLFYASRLLRVWLPFVVAFLAVFALYWLTGDPKPVLVLWGVTLLGLASTHRDVLGTAWSLDIEVQFYLMVPVIWAVLAAALRKGALIWALCGVAGLTVLGWLLQMSFGLWTVLAYLPPFVVGTLIWLMQPRMRLGGAMASLGVFSLAGLVVLAIPHLRPFLIYHAPVPFDLDWFGMAWVLLLTPFVIWNLQQKSSALDMHFGNFSYALYITHWPVIAYLQPVLAPVGLKDKLMIVAVIAVVSVSFYLGVDRQCERLRRRLILRWSGQKLSG